MTDVHPGGNRRIDRVLAEDFVADLHGLSMDDLRDRRAQADQEEVDLSYLRRLLQGRIDIVRAEIKRRAEGTEGSIVEHLAEVLANYPPATVFGLGRHATVEPSRAGEYRRRVDVLVGDVEMTDPARTDEELQEILEVFVREEHGVSTRRRAVQAVMDLCGAELARRYREGEADVDTILARKQH